MIIQDLDLKTDDRWALDKTPFRLVLRKDVDLQRDARILDVGETDTRIYVSLQDKDPNTPGRLKLLLSRKPTMELKEWITTDSQGLDTHVELHRSSSRPTTWTPSCSCHLRCSWRSCSSSPA